MIKNWFKKCCCVSKGDIVLYTDMFDADTSESPNINPAIVVKVNESDGSLDLVVFFINGSFYKADVQKGSPITRGTWHPRD